MRDFERVPLEADSLDSKTIAQFERITDRFLAERTPTNVKQAIIRNVPRRVILKPSHAEEKLGSQSFELGDRVTMVSDRGTVPMSAKGVVVGINDKLIDVVFDTPFIGGTTLMNRFVSLFFFSLSFFSLFFFVAKMDVNDGLKNLTCFFFWNFLWQM